MMPSNAWLKKIKDFYPVGDRVCDSSLRIDRLEEVRQDWVDKWMDYCKIQREERRVSDDFEVSVLGSSCERWWVYSLKQDVEVFFHI